jgi:hypothetical protein
MSPTEFTFLKSLDLDAIQPREVKAISSYADRWVKGEALNQPIRMKRDTFEPEVGQDKFSKAKAAWVAIK